MKDGLHIDAPINPRLANALARAIETLAGAVSFWIVIHASRWW